MEINEGLSQLANQYGQYDWFDSVGMDNFGRYVVYVTKINFEIMTGVQDKLDGKQVLLSYANFKPENLKKYHETITLHKAMSNVSELNISEEVCVEDIVSIDELIPELDRLERICGSKTLQDIFFEIHDGANAVTNNSARYPDVRQDMEELYDEYGFDVLYEELDG